MNTVLKQIGDSFGTLPPVTVYSTPKKPKSNIPMILMIGLFIYYILK